MANLPEQDLWIEGIYQIEQTDDALGGDGEEAIANRQAKQLASRTLFLKNLADALGVRLDTHEEADNPHPQYLLEPQIQALINAAIVPGVTGRSINNLPTEDLGPIIVIEASEVWTWVETAFYEGYRSPLCGAPIAGHTLTPMPYEVDAVGGVVNKAAYARLWAYAQENGLVVSQAVWAANLGAHWFVDVDGSNFRLPDLRNQFIRLAAGAPDLDTANVRTLGSYKADTLKSHTHMARANDGGSLPGPNSNSDNNNGNIWETSATGTAETAPVHTAYFPRLHA